jgi:uncharacterized protein (DUF302 family)
MQMDYTVVSGKSFEETVEAVELGAAESGFRVLAVHDIAATLAEKGFPRELVTIVEVCSTKYSSQVLSADVKIGLLLPCPIMVYAESDQVMITTMRPRIIKDFFPEADIAEVAGTVEDILIAIMDRAAARS